MRGRSLLVVALVIGAIVAALFFWRAQARQSAIGSARERYGRLESAYVKVNGLERKIATSNDALQRALADGTASGSRRHDDADSLSLGETLDLATRERRDYERMQSIERTIPLDLNAKADVISGLYGEGSVVSLRRNEAAMDEALANGTGSLWRAAESIEDNIKGQLNGDDGSNSNDLIVHSYDDAARDFTAFDRFRQSSHFEWVGIKRRLTGDMTMAKADLARSIK